MQRDLVLADALADGGLDGFAAEVADACTVLDDLDLLGRLDHALAHGVLGDVQQLGAVEGGLDALAGHQRQGVVLDAEAAGLDAALAQGLLQAEVEVVALPVGVDDVLAVAGAPRHAGVDVRGDGDRVVGGDDQGVVAAEGGVQEVRVVLDAVVAGQDDGVEVLGGHDGAQAGQAAFELGVGEGQLLLGAVVQDLQALEFGDGADEAGDHWSFRGFGQEVADGNAVGQNRGGRETGDSRRVCRLGLSACRSCARRSRRGWSPTSVEGLDPLESSSRAASRRGPAPSERVVRQHPAASLLVLGVASSSHMSRAFGASYDAAAGPSGVEGVLLPVVERPVDRDLDERLVRTGLDAESVRCVPVEEAGVVQEPRSPAAARRLPVELPPRSAVPRRNHARDAVEGASRGRGSGPRSRGRYLPSARGGSRGDRSRGRRRRSPASSPGGTRP